MRIYPDVHFGIMQRSLKAIGVVSIVALTLASPRKALHPQIIGYGLIIKLTKNFARTP